MQIESRTNLLFSFEKMALCDAVRTGAEPLARGLYELLPRRQTRVLTWPLVTVRALRFAERMRSDNADLALRDMIDLQSFIWVQGSSEYD